ncbi:cytidine deaminase-like protein [Sparassis latifolia]|uniref:Cytidine deaminase n=1 Tax=Sparassis crispa TaxID=139825 RepID=A0A401H4T4_9APHY|nr:Putative cytidine [Sparassis crispa]GBE89413.1 Putative cytidine [Sparassis crispa]
MSATTWAVAVPDKERLIKAAFEAKENAYCRYSNFRVGAALLSANGEVIKGANIENASYGGTICAERTAIVKAVSEGTRSFTALAVVTDVESALSPCGMCRQVLREFCSLNMPIFLVPANYDELRASGDQNGGIQETSIGELLPYSFGPEELELPRRS